MSARIRALVFSLVCVAWLLLPVAAVYNVSVSDGVGARFDGVGGLSGGGCTSRLLVDYPEPQRSQILDILFTPGYAASVQILKVEIGGDADSTEGVEPSHMHTADEENYNRGYEAWLMVEAKRRNPNITLAALAWTFPAWVGDSVGSPLTNATVGYIIKWLQGMKRVHGLDIDYVGIWNEHPFTAQYIISLKQAIQAVGLPTLVLARDGAASWDICPAVATNPALSQAVDVIGAHYPGTRSDAVCSTLRRPLWSSEDYASVWDVGGACLARIINQNYVRGNMTATIAWTLIAAFMDQLGYGGSGLMHAITPWDGHFDVGHPIWVAAHTTHFTRAGWHYLARGQGVGLLDGGGSYVSLTDGQQLTIVIELMPSAQSQCRFTMGPAYTVVAQNATFQLDASLQRVTELYLFSTNVSAQASSDNDFMAHGTIPVVDGRVTLQLYPFMLYTLSTINSQRGRYPPPPPATPFPLPYSDNFDRWTVDSEAPYFFDGAGSWQIFQPTDTTGRVMRQQVPKAPITWCVENAVPYSVVGNHSWTDLNVTAKVRIETTGFAFIGARIVAGGCAPLTGYAATTFGISTDGYWALCNSTVFSAGCRMSGKTAVRSNQWYTLSLVVRQQTATAYLDGEQLLNTQTAVSAGWAGIGSSFDYVQFDDFELRLPAQATDADESRSPAALSE